MTIPVARDSAGTCSHRSILRSWPAVRLLMVGLVLIGAAAGESVLTAGASRAASLGAGAGELRVAGSAATLPSGARVVGPTNASIEVSVDVSLKSRDPALLSAFAKAVSTPGSAQYGRYLTPEQFGAEFGPTVATVAAVREWLTSAGLRAGAIPPDRLMIPVSGTVGQMESAFGVPLVDARLSGGRVARAATLAPQVPASFAGAVEGVIGLSTVARAHPQLRAGPVGTPVVPGAGPAGTRAASVGRLGPLACPAAAAMNGFGAWTAIQLASAYGFDSLYGQGRVGAGQSVALFELEPFQSSDIQTYESCYGVSAPVSTVAVDGGAVGPALGEAALDIEVVAGLAPSSAITVYSGPNGGSGPIDTYSSIVNSHSAAVISTSWGQCEGAGGISPAEQMAESALFLQAKVQGQTVFAAAGDSGSSDCYNPPNGDYNTQITVDDPADQPDVTGVGGTSLTDISTTPPGEVVWNNGTGFGGGAGGGGISADFTAPSWQQIPDAQNGFTRYTCGPSANQQCREVPDVAASSDPFHGDAIFFAGSWRPFGGTSTAAPLWAALTALDNQGCAASAGFLNSKFYAAGAGVSPPFNDITVGNNDLFNPGGPSPHYPATAHYDLASGWGSPRGAALLGTLTGSASGCPAVTGLSSNSGPATGGRTVVIGGSGFGSALPAVHFGAAAAAVVSHTPTSVTVITPDVGTGALVAVTVTTTGLAGGTSADVPAAGYTFVSPQVTGVVPRKGPTGGGGEVTVYGSDFGGATSVRFGSVEATAFAVMSATTLVAQVPPGPGGGSTVDVSVTGPDGTSGLGGSDRYTYALPGYWLVASDGGIFSFGHAGFFGSTGGSTLNKPVAGMAATPDDGGYWLVASDGGIFSFGDAGFYGSTGNVVLNRPVVGMAATPTGHGYWLVASDGGIFAFGDAAFYGSTGNVVLNRPVVGMAATPTGHGYWLVASDGGIFAFGDASFYGSTGALALNQPVAGMAATPTGHGYWLVASDGGIFAFGDAAFYGSTGGMALNRPMVGMASTLEGNGYWLVASDGGIFSFGDTAFFGSTGSLALARPVVGMAST